MSLFSIFHTGIGALTSYSAAMGAIANNIANSSNENYSRQRIEFATQSPNHFGGMEIGRGIYLQSITQVVNSAVELRLNGANQEVGQYTAESSYLRNVENTLNEVSGEGLSLAIADFFNAWTALSAEPESMNARQNVLNNADNMVDFFHSYGDTLAKLRTSIDEELSVVVSQVNDKLEQIAEINQKIDESEVDPLTFMDTRRQLVNELGELIDVNYLDSTDEFMVYTKDGLPLVTGNTVAVLGTVVDVTNDNLMDVNYTVGASTTVITDRIISGKLKGLIDARDTFIAAYQTQLDDLAYTVATEVDALHITGFNLAGVDGVRFFEDLAGVVDDAARLLQIDAAVDDLPANLAIADAPDEVPGGNDIALAITDLFESTGITFQDGSTTSFSGYLGDLWAEVGTDANFSNNNLKFAESVKTQVQLERSQDSGVNVDEEQVELIKMQAAYQSAGRMIQVANEILQALFDALR